MKALIAAICTAIFSVVVFIGATKGDGQQSNSARGILPRAENRLSVEIATQPESESSHPSGATDEASENFVRPSSPANADEVEHMFLAAMERNSPSAAEALAAALSTRYPADEATLEIAASVVLESEQYEIREAAARWVARFATAATIQALEDFSAEAAPDLPQYAELIATIRAVKNGAATEGLIAALQSEDSNVRKAAGIALSGVAPGIASTELLALLAAPAVPLGHQESYLAACRSLPKQTIEGWLIDTNQTLPPMVVNALQQIAAEYD